MFADGVLAVLRATASLTPCVALPIVIRLVAHVHTLHGRRRAVRDEPRRIQIRGGGRRRRKFEVRDMHAMRYRSPPSQIVIRS